MRDKPANPDSEVRGFDASRSPESSETAPTSEIILYQTEDGRTRVQVRLDAERAWLTLNQIAELYARDKSVVSRHIRNIFVERELDPDRTVARFATVQPEGAREVVRKLEFYRLEVVIAVGYRVRSPRGAQFRRWATERLSEYLVKGFALDDARLKASGGGDHFDELLARIRDIRSSEKVFWRKVLDIYSTSVDYDPSEEASRRFFATIQNKMHWAAHGQTAAEVVHRRADAAKPNMGLTSWSGDRPRKSDASVAKNYLAAEEIEALNRIVSAYLDFAEVQAMNRRPMHMADWIAKLDDFLRLGERDVLTHAGSISHEAAQTKAELEYAKFHAVEIEKPSRGERDFEAAVEQVGKFPKPSAKSRGRKPTP